MGREQESIKNISNGGLFEKIHLNDEIDDVKEFQDVTIRNSKITNMGLSKVKINNSRITQTTLKNCYLRNAEFQNVDLTGSKFINCNFEKAKFRVCTFRYVEFHNCKLNIDEILGNLPTEPNLKISLLKQLYINQNLQMEKKSCDKLLLKIAREEKVDWRSKFLCKNSYYKDRNTIDRIYAFIQYILNNINDFVWGYGISIARLLRFALITIFVFAILINTFNAKFFNTLNNNELVKLNFFDSLFSSYVNFTSVGMGYFIPANCIAKLFFVFENMFGLLFIGCLVAALYRRISK